MLQIVSALKGYAIEASDGKIGTIRDFLFDDITWKMRWLVVDAGTWLTDRKVLVHPSVIGPLDHERRALSVRLTREQVKASPDTFQDQPVSRQMEYSLYQFYGWDPLWGDSSYFEGGAMASPLLSPPLFGAGAGEAASFQSPPDHCDPNLRSVAVVTGYAIEARDGDIGHVEDFLVDDAAWGIRYLVIATRNWWPGQHVLVSPYAVREIATADQHVRLGISRNQVKASPPWKRSDKIDQAYEQQLHSHYDWPGYGW